MCQRNSYARKSIKFDISPLRLVEDVNSTWLDAAGSAGKA